MSGFFFNLKYLEKEQFKIEGDLINGSAKTNNLKPENILFLPVNATIKRNFANNKVFENKIEIDENGDKSEVPLEKSFFGLIEEEYYRFNFNFLTMILTSFSISGIAIDSFKME